MRLSEKNQQRLYQAISKPIVDLRIDTAQQEYIPQGIRENIDSELFKLEHQIWQRIKTVLNIKDIGG